jgi:hypothetical protein
MPRILRLALLGLLGLLSACEREREREAPPKADSGYEHELERVDDLRVPEDVMLRVATAMQQPNTNEMMTWLRGPEVYAPVCDALPWHKQYRTPSEKEREIFALNLHNCVPAGTISSVEMISGYGHRCTDALTLWYLVEFEVVTAKGSATLEFTQLLLDGDGNIGWMIREPFPEVPRCVGKSTLGPGEFELTAEPGLAELVGPGVELGAPLDSIATQWGEQAQAGRARRRSDAVTDLAWHTPQASGGVVARYDPDSGACLLARGEGMRAQSFHVERAYDPAFANALVELWGPAENKAGQAADTMLWRDPKRGLQTRLARRKGPNQEVWMLEWTRAVAIERLLVNGVLALDDKRPLLEQRRADLLSRHADQLCDEPLTDIPHVRLCPVESLIGADGPSEVLVEFSDSGRSSQVTLTVHPDPAGELEQDLRAQLERVSKPRKGKEHASPPQSYVLRRGKTQVSLSVSLDQSMRVTWTACSLSSRCNQNL